MIRLILASLGLAALTVMLHGAGTTAAVRFTAGMWAGRVEPKPGLRASLFLACLVSLLMMLHIVEAVVWAAFLRLAGVLPDFQIAVYFSLTSYATVGYGDVVLPEPWRMFGPIEGSVGILMYGWSTAILVAFITAIYRQLFSSLATRNSS